MSRSLGDEVATEVGVIPIPHIRDQLITENDKAIILATDGIWEHLSN